jgi:BA14K-like protein
MFRTSGIAALLALAFAMPAQQAQAQDPLLGGLFGGAAGAIIGGAVGGGRGAAIGALIGGASGAIIAAEGQRRGAYYWWHQTCYIQRPDGAWVVVAPNYCAPPAPPPAVVYVPPPPPPPPPGYVVAPPPPGPGYVAAPPPAADVSAVDYCAQRYKSYDPATGTYLGFDGQRHPCP